MSGVLMESVTQRRAAGRCLEICPGYLEQLSVQMIVMATLISSLTGKK